jgi:hypothetical protein
MSDTMNVFKTIILVQLFFSFAITGIAYALPEDAKHYVSSASDLANEIDLEGTGKQIESSLEQQTNIPVIELGALVFYSGNIIIDLILNFIFAIPQMFGLLINLLLMVFGAVDYYLTALVQIFISVTYYSIYLINAMQTMTNVRSGRVI